MWWHSAAGNARYYGIIALAAILVFCMAACEGEEEPSSTPSPSLTLPASATPAAQSSELPTATPAGLFPLPTVPPNSAFPAPEEAIVHYWEEIMGAHVAGNCMEVGEEDVGKYCYQLSKAQYLPYGPRAERRLNLYYNIGVIYEDPLGPQPAVDYRYCDTVQADGEGSWMLVPKGLVGHQCEPREYPHPNYESAEFAMLASAFTYPEYDIKGEAYKIVGACEEIPTPVGHPPPLAEPLACYSFHHQRDGFWYYDVTKYPQYPLRGAPSACVVLYNQGHWWIVQELIDEPCE